jgi:hypothetical protein
LHCVDFVDKDDDLLYPNLTSEEEMFSGLRPRTISLQSSSDSLSSYICPSLAATTTIAPSMLAAPVIMFLI